jgi:hypothetical protein
VHIAGNGGKEREEFLHDIDDETHARRDEHDRSVDHKVLIKNSLHCHENEDPRHDPN